MAKKKDNKIGGWAFLIGVILAFLFGVAGSAIFGGYMGYILPLLIIIGLVVGFLNIADAETTPFLMSGAVLIIASAFGSDTLSSVAYVNPIFQALMAIFVPAVVIVAIRNVFKLARN
jgi:hypothetical protein